MAGLVQNHPYLEVGVIFLKANAVGTGMWIVIGMQLDRLPQIRFGASRVSFFNLPNGSVVVVPPVAEKNFAFNRAATTSTLGEVRANGLRKGLTYDHRREA